MTCSVKPALPKAQPPPHTMVPQRAPRRRIATGTVLCLLMAGPVVSCSSAESERTVTKDVEEGFLEPAPRVFGDEDGSETEVTSPSLRGEVMNHGTDSFVPYVDPPRDVSQYCGDGAYDPALEECDDGYGTALDVCSKDCQTRDILAVPPSVAGNLRSRALGTGPHPLSGHDAAGALVWMDLSAEPQLVLQRRDYYGNRTDEVVLVDAATVDGTSRPTRSSHPVVATLPDGSHVVAYNDLNGDQGELGVALIHVTDEGTEFLGYPYDTRVGAQYDADVVWTGQRLVVAWSDTSDEQNGPDVNVREYGSDVGALGSARRLAATPLPEAHVTLCVAPGRDGWAAAWRRGEAAGNESIVVSHDGQVLAFRPTWDGTTASVELTLEPAGGTFDPNLHLMPGHMDDRLGLAPVGQDQFVVAFTVGTDPLGVGVANVFRLWAAVLDFAQEDVVWIGPVGPKRDGAPDATHSQRSPALADGSSPYAPGASGRAYLAWRSEGQQGDAAGEDLWLKRLDWDAQSGELSTEHEEVPLVREVRHGSGDQRAPALATVPVPGGHALAMAWEDWGRNFDDEDRTQALPDIAVQVAPVPLRRDDDKIKDCAHQPCATGEGPCERDEDCAGSLICAARRGPFHGYGPATAVCEPASCSDQQKSTGEVGVDCGGECGPCFPCAGAASSSGTAHFCSAVCLCDDVEGDCDSDYDCVEGLECFEDQGQLAGYPEGIDLCMAGHCQNGQRDQTGDQASEAGVDCGGADCLPCAPGLPEYCSTENVCSEVGLGGCKSDAGCGSDNGVALVCAAGQGALYGHPSGQGACVPQVCALGRGANFSTTACSAECPCGPGGGGCLSDEDCLAGTVCAENRGLYFGQGTGLNVCVPTHCTNGAKDADEISQDCGGLCGTECSACVGNPATTSFEYPADSSGTTATERGWSVVEPVLEPGLVWSKSGNASEGAESLAFSGCGEATLRSPQFLSHDFPLVGDVLHLDLAFAQTSPSADSHVKFTLSVRDMLHERTVEVLDVSYPVADTSGQFVTQAIALPAEVRNWLAEDRGGLQWELHLDYCGEEGQDFLWLDHVRFGGRSVAQRSACQATALPEDNLTSGADALSFDNVGLWESSDTTIVAETNDVRQGSGAARLEGHSHSIHSNRLIPLQFGQPLTLDVRLPASTGGLSGSIVVVGESCVGMSGPSTLGTITLAGLPAGQWVTIPLGTLTPPSDSGVRCAPRINTTLSGADLGSTMLFDNMRFQPASHCNEYPQIDAVPFAVGMSPGPDGTAARPYRLCTAGQMQTLMDDASLWDKSFVLESDIDLSGVVGQIATPAAFFRGTFDGNHHYLSNYSLNGNTHAGLFSVLWGDGVLDGVTDGVIKNLTLSDADVSGTRFVGGLVGVIEQNGVVQDVYVAGGQVFGTGSILGGLAGRSAGIIERSYSSADVVSDASSSLDPGRYVGGLVGSATGPIRESRALGDITSPTGAAVGGLVGELSSPGSVQDSSAHGSVSVDGDAVGGLLGKTVGATSIIDSSAHGDVLLGSTSHSAGGLVGDVATGGSLVIEQSHAAGSVLGGDHSLGGLVGHALSVTVSESSATGSVEAHGSSNGGLLGVAVDSDVSRCFATGSVVGEDQNGGLIGQALNTAVTDSYAWGDVGHNGIAAGGLVGAGTGITVTRSYALGALGTLDASAAGALVGADGNADGTYAANFFQGTRNPGLWSVGGGLVNAGADKSPTEFLDEETFAAVGWDFLNVWVMAERGPELRRSLCTLHETITQAPFLSGMSAGREPDGSATRPYVLCNAEQVQWLMDHQSASHGSVPLLSSHYALESDIDLTAVTGNLGSVAAPFQGVLDGRGHTLRNYSFHDPTRNQVGLLGRVGQLGQVVNLDVDSSGVHAQDVCGVLVGANYGQIRDVVVRRSSATGRSSLGGVVGQNYGKLIRVISRENAVVSSGESSGVGGVVGSGPGGTMTDCHTMGGTVQGYQSVGGLSGGLNSGTVSASSADAHVIAAYRYVGGLIGYVYGSPASGMARIIASRATGPVQCESRCGGLVGLLYHSSVEGSEAKGAVSGTGQVGGAIGSVVEGSQVIDSSASGDVTSSSSHVGGFAGTVADTLSAPQGTQVSGCRATGKVSGGTHLGGAIGRVTNGALVEDCQAFGTVVANGSYAGGLVGTVDAATVRRSRAHGPVLGLGYSGGFVGWATNDAALEECMAIGRVDSPNGRVGGFAGQLGAGAIALRCAAHGSVSARNRAGGLVGQLEGAVIRSGAAYGDVRLTNGTEVGGLVGRANGSLIEFSQAFGDATNETPGSGGHVSGGLVGAAYDQTTIARSESHGAAHGAAQVGGLVGRLDESSLIDSYATGQVEDMNGNAGGLVGHFVGVRVTRSYSKSEVVSGGGTVAGERLEDQGDTFEFVYGNSTVNPDMPPLHDLPGQPGAYNLSSTQMLSQASFEGWDFIETWQMGSEGPVLRSGHCSQVQQQDEPPFVAGVDVAPTGGVDDPFLLCTAAQVQAVMDAPNLWASNFRLAQSIDLAGVSGQIGTTVMAFKGTFDGAGYELFNYSWVATGADAGLFGYVVGDGEKDGSMDGHIRALRLVQATVSGLGQSGAVVGRADRALLEALSASGSVSSEDGTSESTGGLVGLASNETILRDSHAEITVVGFSQVGGLVGTLGDDSRVQGCSASGDVSAVEVGASNVGGLVGRLVASTIEDSAASGDVASGGPNVGGLVGRLESYSYIAGATASGEVMLTNGTAAGGLVGMAYSYTGQPAVPSGAILDSSASGAVTALNGDKIGGLIGHAQFATLLDSHATGAVVGGSTVGGFAGEVSLDSTLTRCWSSGNVTATGPPAGGLIARLVGGNVSDCYSTGSVSGTSDVGGLVGAAQSGTVQRSYSGGLVSGTGTRGALVGSASSLTLSGTFGNAELNPSLNAVGSQPGASGVALLDGAQLSNSAVFEAAGWDFESVWRNGAEGPTLRAGTESARDNPCIGHQLSNTVPFVLGLEATPTGTPDDPYPICNVGQLSSFWHSSDLTGASFRLHANIDISGLVGHLGASTPYSGVFDGNGYALSGYSSSAGGGLFDTVSGTIQALRLVGFDVAGSGATGLLANVAQGATIADVEVVDGSVSGVQAVGGVVGLLDSESVIRDCVVRSGTVVNGSGAHAGGIAGDASGSIQRTESAATVATDGWAGGLVGRADGALIVDSLVSGTVTSHSSEAGGLAGSASSADFARSVVRAGVSAPNAVGAAVGSELTSSSYFGLVVAESVVGTAPLVGNRPEFWVQAGVPDAALTQSGTFADRDFDLTQIWQVGAAGPTLRDNPELYCEEASPADSGPFIQASGTAEDPYRICTPGQLLHVQQDPAIWDAQFILEADIQVTLTAPIGNDTTPFTGTFDGNGHVLRGLELSGGDDVGLFGKIEGDGGYDAAGDGVVRHLYLARFDVAGENNVGALAGRLLQGRIEDVQLQAGHAQGTRAGLGGLIGLNAGSVVRADVDAQVSHQTAPDQPQAYRDVGGVIGFSQGYVSDAIGRGYVTVASAGDVAAGGVVGRTAGGQVYRCQGWGNVEVEGNQAGGLIGRAEQTVIEDAVAWGHVTALWEAGGLVGRLWDGHIFTSLAYGDTSSDVYSGGLVAVQVGATVQQSHAYGSVWTNNSSAGGLVGYVGQGGTVSKSSAHGAVMAQMYAGGLIGFAPNDTGVLSNIEDVLSTSTVLASYAYGGGLFGRIDNYNVQRAVSRAVAGKSYVESSANFAGYMVNTHLTDCVFGPFLGLSGYSDGTSTGSLTSVSLSQLGDTGRYSGLDFSGTWVMRAGGPVLTSGPSEPGWCETYTQISAVPFVTDAPVPPDGSVESPYVLCSTDQLLAVMNSGALWSKSFRLGAHLQFGASSGQMGTAAAPFTGTFDGQGHALIDFAVTGASDVGLFGVVSGGRIEDLTLVSPDVSGYSNVGAAVGRLDASASLDGVRMIDGTVDGQTLYIGGVVGRANGSLRRVVSSGFVDSDSSQDVGGIVGRVDSGREMLECMSSSAVTQTGTGGKNVAGMIGDLRGTARDCHYAGDVLMTSSESGGLVGKAVGGQILDSNSIGTVTVTASVGSIGGLVGVADGTLIKRSKSSSIVSGYQRVGGLAGYILNDTQVEGCWALGDVTASYNSAGGLVGYTRSATAPDWIVRKSYATGNVHSEDYAGGLMGYVRNGTIEDSYAWGAVTVEEDSAGGLVGEARDLIIARSYSMGDVTAAIAGKAGSFIGNRDPAYPSVVTASFGNKSFNSNIPQVGSGALGGVGYYWSSVIRGVSPPPPSEYAHWDFDNVWQMTAEGPVLR